MMQEGFGWEVEIRRKTVESDQPGGPRTFNAPTRVWEALRFPGFATPSRAFAPRKLRLVRSPSRPVRPEGYLLPLPLSVCSSHMLFSLHFQGHSL